MNFSPYSIAHAPAALPVWQSIMDDLGRPHPAAVAKVLGLGARTVYRYNREAWAPRHVCLALFWLTRWGRSAVDCQAVNDCQVAVGYANALERELREVRTQLAHVLAVGQFDSTARRGLHGAAQPRRPARAAHLGGTVTLPEPASTGRTAPPAAVSHAAPSGVSHGWTSP